MEWGSADGLFLQKKCSNNVAFSLLILLELANGSECIFTYLMLQLKHSQSIQSNVHTWKVYIKNKSEEI
jgi:hypothetical protein